MVGVEQVGHVMMGWHITQHCIAMQCTGMTMLFTRAHQVLSTCTSLNLTMTLTARQATCERGYGRQPHDELMGLGEG